MSTNNDDLIRRTRVSTKRTKSQRDERNGIGSSTTKEVRRNRRLRRDERNRRIALLLIAWIIFVVAVYFLYQRWSRKNESGKKMRHHSGKLIGLRTGDLDGTMRYLDPRQLPPLPGEPDEPYKGKGRKGGFRGEGDDEWKSDEQSAKYRNGPIVDYTNHDYQYPDLMFEPPNDGSYPPLERMATVFETWEQDNIDNPPDTLVEVLQHFDYQDPDQLEVSELVDHCSQFLVSSAVQL
jgi:hypothetical protein